MKKMPIIILSCVALTMSMASGKANAASLTVTQDDALHLPQVIGGLQTFTATGAKMAGMEVSVFFDGGFSETLPWVAGAGDLGGVIGANWSLSQSGDTYSTAKPWLLNNTRTGNSVITNIFIDGGVSAASDTVVFDRTFTDKGTTDSDFGRDFVFPVGFTNSLDITVTYSGAVGVGWGTPPVGDLFRYLSIDFGVDNAGLGNTFFAFVADTDMVAGATTPVPLPGTALLFGSGLLGLLGFSRKRKKLA